MRAIYSDYENWKGWLTKPFGVFDAASAVYFCAELSRSGLSSVRDLRMLEIGFGNGEFAGWASRAGARYLGTEAIPELVAKGREAGFDVHDASIPLEFVVPQGDIDVVIALDVFEHLDRDGLWNVLVSLRNCMKPGGRLVSRVPSGDSPFSRAVQHGDLTHRLILGSSAVRQLAHEAGFEVVSVREPAFPLRGLGLRVFLRRLGVVAARRLLFPIITHAFMGGGQPVLTTNLVFVLVKP